MKRLFMLLAACWLTFSCLFAESDLFHVGVTAGANITKADGDGSGFLDTGWDADAGGGFYIGAQARISVPLLNFGIDASFVYSQETAHVQTEGAPYTDRLRYFCIPVHIRYDFELVGISEAIIPFAFIGPQCNLALNDFDWYSLVKDDPDLNAKIDEVKNNVTSKHNWKLDLGFGVLLLKHVQIAYNYAIPLNDTFQFNTAFEDSKNNFKLGTHRIGVTYFF